MWTARGLLLADLPELEQREISDYVLSQTRKLDPDDDVSVVQKVGRRRLSGIIYDLYDVRMSSGKRSWVFMNHTNLYRQDRYAVVRIVSLLPSTTEILFAIGAGPEAVGVTHL
jgi:hypothetical protein